MRVDLSIDYPKTEGSVILFVHEFPKDTEIKINEARDGMGKRVMIGNVEICLFEEEDKNEGSRPVPDNQEE